MRGEGWEQGVGVGEMRGEGWGTMCVHVCIILFSVHIPMHKTTSHKNTPSSTHTHYNNHKHHPTPKPKLTCLVVGFA